MWITFNIVDPIFRICSLLLVKKYIYIFPTTRGSRYCFVSHFGHEKKNGRSSASRQVMLVFFCLGIIASAQTDFSLNRQILNIQSFIQHSKESRFQKFVLKVV